MRLLEEYHNARHDEETARLRRFFVLRAMVAAGSSQRQIAEMLGISQSAVSQQLRSVPDLKAFTQSACSKRLRPFSGPSQVNVATRNWQCSALWQDTMRAKIPT